MSNQTISRGYLRLRSGIALVILTVASLSAFYVSLIGQRYVVENAQNTHMLDQIMVSLAEFSLAFDEIKFNPESEAALTAGVRLQENIRIGEEAVVALQAAYESGSYCPETRYILSLDALNPIGTFREVIMIAHLMNYGERTPADRARSAVLGAEMSRQVLPSYMRMSEVESAAAARFAEGQQLYSVIAIAIGLFGILVVGRFVHMPMERFIITATADIAESQREAEAASEAKSVFLATMSHEIRTPLNGVMGLSELLQDSEKDPARRKMLDMIVSSGHALLQVINDVLDLSKIEAGKAEFESQVFDARALCEEAVELFSAQAHRKGVELRFEVKPENTSWMVKGASKAVRQMTLNLVNNAVKFTDEGSVTLKLEFGPDKVTDGHMTGHQIRIAVSDTGIGISETALPYIFEQFSQADTSTTTRFGGTGLGLSIVKKLSDAMGADIHATSVLGWGSTFILDVPVIIQPAAAPASAAVGGRKQFTGKVLVADDNEVNLLVAEKMLLKMGCSVMKASNGKEAVTQQRSWHPDLILMDVRMPEMDGLEATRILREEGAINTDGPLPIVGLSANALTEHQQEGIEFGMNGYLTKPLRKVALEDELAKYLRFDIVETKGASPKCA
ncbi:ATP-binding protein [Shimia sp.]|uniref:ATP-binding protein n=1 Tax=Shimia sp. TaxID=1954381 RepID=UPI003B8C72C4